MYADFIMLKAEDMIKNPFHVGAARYHITGEKVKLHWHNYFTLDLIIGGSGTHRINGQSEKLCPGMVQMIYPTDIHAIVPDGDIELYSIRFEESALSAELFDIIYGREIRKLSPDRKIFDRMCAAAAAMAEELEFSQRTFCGELTELNFRQIILLAARAADWEKKAAKSTAEKILLYINEHFRENLSLEQTAAQAGFSAPYFSAYFKKEVGKTYSRYVNGLKVNYAQTLLKNTDYSMTEICFASGFGSVSAFNSVFRHETGVSPTQFRESHVRI